MITDAIRRLNRVMFIHTTVMVLMLGIACGLIVDPTSEFSGILIALLAWVVLMVAVSIAHVVVTRRTNNALLAQTATASRAILETQPSFSTANPAQIVRRRVARRQSSYVLGYAETPPPALVMMLRVITPAGARLAIALAPPAAIPGRASSHVGVRLDPAHPDVAVLDPAGSPDEMRVQYESAMALPGFKKLAVGWGSTARSASYGLATGLSVGFVIGLLLP
jgi:hypothetical protein